MEHCRPLAVWAIVIPNRSRGIAAAVRKLTEGWHTTYTGYAVSSVAPWLAGLLWPVPWAFLKAAPHGKDGPSLSHAKVYRKALGDQKFFHGDALGPLDVTLYASLACFADGLGSPQAAEALDHGDGGLRRWYDSVAEQYVKVVGAKLY